jgi:t-SNARE complex subunit (syntaxin)
MHSVPPTSPHIFLVKPDATAEEVAAVVNDDSGAQSQVFAQAVRINMFFRDSSANTDSLD